MFKVAKDRLNKELFVKSVEAAIAREEEDLSKSKSNAQRLRDALKLLLSVKQEFKPFLLGDELRVILQRTVKQSNSPMCKQLAQQCLVEMNA